MKIIIGAGKTSFPGWISTQENELNLLRRADFERILPAAQAALCGRQLQPMIF